MARGYHWVANMQIAERGMRRIAARLVWRLRLHCACEASLGRLHLFPGTWALVPAELRAACRLS